MRNFDREVGDAHSYSRNDVVLHVSAACCGKPSDYWCSRRRSETCQHKMDKLHNRYWRNLKEINVKNVCLCWLWGAKSKNVTANGKKSNKFSLKVKLVIFLRSLKTSWRASFECLRQLEKSSLSLWADQLIMQLFITFTSSLSLRDRCWDTRRWNMEK